MLAEPTEHQKGKLEELLFWWKLPKTDPQWKTAILSAPAGCGKTFLARYLTQKFPGVHAVFTATTNEAVRQLELAGVKAYGTTHSLLGLIPKFTEEKPYFYQNKLPESIFDYNLIIVDEGSMAGKAEKDDLYQVVDYLMELPNHRILFLADKYQLPPIDSSKGISPIFEQNYYLVQMEKVMRNSGAILEYCISIREQIDKAIKVLPKIREGETISVKKSSEIISWLQQPEQLEKLQKGTLRILAYTNSLVDRYNSCIRTALYGEEISKIPVVAGDVIIFITPLFYGNFPKNLDDLEEAFKQRVVNQEASINSRAIIVSTKIVELYGVECFYTQFQLETGKTALGYIPTFLGEKKLNALKKAFLKSVENKKNKAKDWEFWHTFSSCFASYKYGYALTVHRAQGSNILETVIDIPNISLCRQQLIRYKLLYTACSRTKNHMTLVRS